MIVIITITLFIVISALLNSHAIKDELIIINVINIAFNNPINSFTLSIFAISHYTIKHEMLVPRVILCGVFDLKGGWKLKILEEV